MREDTSLDFRDYAGIGVIVGLARVLGAADAGVART